MPRLFVAVWPPPEVLDRIAALPRPSVPGLRWTTVDQWHITLRFLGSVPDAGPVVAALDRAAATGERPEVLVGSVVVAEAGPHTGRFGHRILHVPVGGLVELAATVVAATAGVGEPPDDRPFTGHITLARVAKSGAVDLRPLVGAPFSARWDVTELTLVESRLGAAGARYEVVARFPFTPRS